MSEQTELPVEKPKRQIDPRILERRAVLRELADAEDKLTRAEARQLKARGRRAEAIAKVGEVDAYVDAAKATVQTLREAAAKALGLSQNGDS